MVSNFSDMESLGEEQVRLKISSLEWSGTQALRAKQWLEMRVSSNARDANEIARKALRSSYWANAIAIVAVIIAVFAIK